LKKNINPITFHFVEEGPGRGSEDIKKECNVKCFDFFFFSVFLMDVMGGKIILPTILCRHITANSKQTPQTASTS